MAKTPEEMAAAMLENLPTKTGKPLDEWLKILASTGLEKHGQLLKHLKSEHGVTHGFASLIAHQHLAAQSGGEPAEADLVSAQYSGPKADLKPIYDALIETATALGDDVDVAPKKSYVSLRRSKQFGLIQPSTKTRVDLGLKLDAEPEGRLEASGSFNAMVSHRVRLESPADVDDDVKRWLQRAYESA